MLRSKSRSRFLKFGRKSQKLAISRTISASRFCRGDPLISQIDATAHKPLDRNSSNGVTSSEFVVQLTEELKMTKALLEVAEQEKDRALDELREMKMEIEVSKQIDARLAEKDMLIDGLEVELGIFKASRSVIMESLSESKQKIKELEKEIEKIRVSEKLEDAKLDDGSLREKLENLDNYEVSSLKSELVLALKEKEKSKRAMDDLASALQEAKMEANNARVVIGLKEAELDKVKQEAEEHVKILEEARRDKERYKNTVERLRLEADESLLAWNEREMGFVKCVKEAEDERTRTQEENVRLFELLKSANTTVDMLREENLKLKVGLKQATGIGKIENNFQPNHTHSEKDDCLDYLTEENRKLSVKELNRPLIVATIKDPKIDSKKQGAKTKSMKTMFDDSKKGKIQKNRLSFDLSELKKRDGNEDVKAKVGEEVPVKAEILTGSVFDTVDPPTLLTRRASFSFLNGETCVHPEAFGRSQEPGVDSSGNSWIQKRRVFLQSFEDLIRGRSVEKGEKSVE